MQKDKARLRYKENPTRQNKSNLRREMENMTKGKGLLHIGNIIEPLFKKIHGRDWKHARIIPTHKKKDRSDPQN